MATMVGTDSALDLGPLTDRQRRLLGLLAAGATVAEIALRLDLSRRATQRAVADLLTALNASTSAEACLLWWGSRAGARADLRQAVEVRAA